MPLKRKSCLLLLLIVSCCFVSAQKSLYLEAGAKTGKLSPLWKGASDIKSKVTPYVSLNLRRRLIKDQLYIHFGVGYQRVGETMEYSTMEDVYIILNDEITIDDIRNGTAEPGDFREDRIEVTSDYDLYVDMVKFPLKVEYKWNSFQVMAGMFLTNAFGGKYKYTFVHPHHIYYRVAGEGNHDLVTTGHPISDDNKIYEEDDDIRINRLGYGYQFSVGYKWKRLGAFLTYEHGLSYIDKEDRTVASVFDEEGKSSFQYRHPDYADTDDGRLKMRNFSLGLVYYIGSGHER